MVPFAGWEMPVQYPAGILAEHRAVRTGAGLFDVSHMGEFEVTGPDRNAFVNRITCNDVAALDSGGVQYSAILTPEGTFIDDCTVYRFDDKVMIVVNAANVARAMGACGRTQGRRQRPSQGHLPRGGPACAAGPEGAGAAPAADAGAAFRDRVLSLRDRTGRRRRLLHLAHRLHRRRRLRALFPRPRRRTALGGDHRRGSDPVGLGARDSLRLEMGYALYGNDIDDTITPLEAGLGWIVKLDKGAPFVGDAALRSQKQRGVTRKLVGFELEGRGFPRHGYLVYHEGREVDVVRSGTMGPSVGRGIGTTYLPAAAAKAGTRFEVDCRGERLPAVVVPRPFYKQGSVRK